MAIFPENEHFKLTMYSSALLGVWPFIFEDNPTLQKLYNIYSNCTFYYYLLFIISAIIELLVLICDEVIIVSEIVSNLCITLLYSVTILRVHAIKTPRVKTIIRQIIVLEQRIYKCEDDGILKIYNSHVRQSKVSNAIFLVNIFLVTALYFIHPLFVDDLVKHYVSRNETVIVKALPLSSWFPFDKQKYYLQAYLWHILDGTVGASFVTYTDIFTFSLIIFPLGQIKILKLILSNFDVYAKKIKDQINCSQQEASFVTLRECILKHKEIILYVNEFNAAMRNIMVLDFLQSSMQLASIVLQLLMTKVTMINFIYSGQFAFSMFIRLLVYYWYANEIMSHSSEIGHALCSSKWYEEPLKIKKMMVIMMMRCGKQLCLEIGPFTVMTLSTFLGENFEESFDPHFPNAARTIRDSTEQGPLALTFIVILPTQGTAQDPGQKS